VVFSFDALFGLTWRMLTPYLTLTSRLKPLLSFGFWLVIPLYALVNNVLLLCMIMAVIALLVGHSQSFASLHLYWEGIFLVHPTPKTKVFPMCPWYVQNVSTFPNTFAVVSPLICMFWIQLTRTNAVFSRIALVSCFCAEIQLSGKIPENTAKILFYQKTHETRIRDGEGPGGHHTTWWRWLVLAALGGGVAALAISLTPPSAYIYPLTWKYRGFSVFPR
jgi:hypothetical protein